MSDNEVTEMWKEYRQEQQERRAARLPIRTQEILNLRAFDYTVTELTEFQFRVSMDGESLDLYPTHRRYHVLGSNKRGNYGSALSCVQRWLPVSRAPQPSTERE